MDLAKDVFREDQVRAGVIPTGDDVCRFNASVLEDVVKSLVEEKLQDENAKMSDVALSNGRKPCPTFVVATSATRAETPPCTLSLVQLRRT